jgi:hypothetical protein
MTGKLLFKLAVVELMFLIVCGFANIYISAPARKILSLLIAAVLTKNRKITEEIKEKLEQGDFDELIKSALSLPDAASLILNPPNLSTAKKNTQNDSTESQATQSQGEGKKKRNQKKKAQKVGTKASSDLSTSFTRRLSGNELKALDEEKSNMITQFLNNAIIETSTIDFDSFDKKKVSALVCATKHLPVKFEFGTPIVFAVEYSTGDDITVSDFCKQNKYTCQMNFIVNVLRRKEKTSDKSIAAPGFGVAAKNAPTITAIVIKVLVPILHKAMYQKSNFAPTNLIAGTIQAVENVIMKV